MRRLLSVVFSFHGRVGRKWFWLSHFILLALVTVGFIGLLTFTFAGVAIPGSHGKIDPGQLPRMVTGIRAFGAAIVVVPLLYYAIRLSVDARRLHDRGKSATLLIPMCIPGWIYFFSYGPSVKMMLFKWAVSGATATEVVLFAAMMGAGLWYWVELGFCRGDRTDNEYGAAPDGNSPVVFGETDWPSDMALSPAAITSPTAPRLPPRAEQKPAEPPRFGKRRAA